MRIAIIIATGSLLYASIGINNYQTQSHILSQKSKAMIEAKSSELRQELQQLKEAEEERYRQIRERYLTVRKIKELKKRRLLELKKENSELTKAKDIFDKAIDQQIVRISKKNDDLILKTIGSLYSYGKIKLKDLNYYYNLLSGKWADR